MNDLLSSVYLGQVAALATAFCWTVSILCFEHSSKKFGALTANVLKMYLGFAFFSVFAWIFRGAPFPMDASGHAWLWLGLSGVIGFVLGDLYLFKALRIIGARTSMLVFSLVPPITAVIGFFILGETISPRHCLGMSVTIGGVAAVILTRENGSKGLKHPVEGLVFAVIGTVGQAVGLVLGKYGMGEYNAFSATQIRIFAGLVVFTFVMIRAKAWGQLVVSLKDIPTMRIMLLGSVFGPFIGVYLSQVAIQNTSTGIASTIMAIVPVIIIPFSMVLFKEKINRREIVGAIIAFGGTAIMFS